MKDYKPTGIFINQNEKGQYIYSDFLTKGGYLILQSDYEKYRVYSMRYTISIIVAILLSTFVSFKIAILVGLLTALVGEILFRVKFLKTLTHLDDYRKNEDSTVFNKLTSSSSNGRKIIKALLCIAFGTLLVINAYQQNYSQAIITICYIVSGFSLIMAILYIISYFKERK